MICATLIPGDGIGPEVIDSAVRCLEATGVKISWNEVPAGQNALKKHDSLLPEKTLESIRKNKIALKGPITTPVGKGFRSVNVGLRKELGLFANVRPAKIFKGVRTNFRKANIVVIRENLEDLYSGIEYKKGEFKDRKKNISKDSAVSLKVISEKNSKNIIRFAFDYALRNKRSKVTAVHKANILKFTDGMFLDIARKISRDYGKIDFEDRIVDNMCMQLVQKPEIYDVLVCPNLYGDIISDLCSGIVGGLGIAPSANIGKNIGVFEPVHGSAPKYAGKNKVNPSSAILSGALMLRHVGKTREADRLESAVASVIYEGRKVTYDINQKKNVGTKEMASAIINEI